MNNVVGLGFFPRSLLFQLLVVFPRSSAADACSGPCNTSLEGRWALLRGETAAAPLRGDAVAHVRPGHVCWTRIPGLKARGLALPRAGGLAWAWK